MEQDAIFLANVWKQIRKSGWQSIIDFGDVDGIDFVANRVLEAAQQEEEMDDPVVTSVTNDWVSTFEKSENQNGFMWRMAGRGILPECVDPQDERVIVLCKKAAQQCVHPTSGESTISAVESTPENQPSNQSVGVPPTCG